jgi:hypothetical protein
MVRKSPRGFILRIKLPLKTTNATPSIATTEPDTRFPVSLSFLYIRKDRKAVRIGVIQSIKETLEARVMPNAVFSVIKYSEPPHNPNKKNKNSSVKLFDKNTLGEKNHMPT